VWPEEPVVVSVTIEHGREPIFFWDSRSCQGCTGLRGQLPSHHPLAVQSKTRWVPGADRNPSPEHKEKQGAEKESLACSQLAVR
jgi:hypothetical protein